MTSATDNRPRNCRHCSYMTCGDANWCSELEVVRNNWEIWAHTDCALWEWNPIDALTLEDIEHDRLVAEKIERDKYEKRMRGDWS